MKKIIALILSSLLYVSVVGCSSKLNDDDIVAKVNENNITLKQFQKTLALYKLSLESMYGSTIWDTEVEDGIKYKDKYKDIMLDQMIDIEAVCDKVKKEGLAPSKEEVDKAFEELRTSIDKDTDYKKKLEDIGIDDTYLRKEQEQSLTVQRYKDNFEKNIKITDEEMKKYYDEHKKDYYKDEVKVSHILISTVDNNGKEVSESKKKEAKKKAEQVLKEAKSGEEFSQLAKDYSDDKESASQGGDLGYISKGQMPQSFEDTAFSLKSGEISDIVVTKYGYHIIKVYDKINKQLTFDEVKDEIKSTLIENKYMENVKEITKKSKIEKNESIIKKVKF